MDDNGFPEKLTRLISIIHSKHAENFGTIHGVSCLLNNIALKDGMIHHVRRLSQSVCFTDNVDIVGKTFEEDWVKD